MERNAQKLLSTPESSNLTFVDNFYGITFQAPLFNDILLITVQDPKHATKTARNQLFSGARLLTFAQTTVRYDQILEVQKHGSVLLSRDVINVDKQDDLAALRTFSSAFLNEVISKCLLDDTYCGLVCFLFVFGDVL